MSIFRKAAIGFLSIFGAVYAQKQPLLGNGWGLDHTTVMQRSAAEARQVFGSGLGFSVRPGTKFPARGLEDAIINLPPGYLELMWIYDGAKSESIVAHALLRAAFTLR